TAAASCAAPPPSDRDPARRVTMRLRLPALLLTLPLAACSETGPNLSGLDPIAISRIELSPAIDTIEVLEPFGPEHSLRLFATVVMKSGVTRNDVILAWRTSDPAVALVDGTGRVRATGFGTTIVT